MFFRMSRHGCPEHLAFSSRRPRKAFYGESGSLQRAAHGSFGAVGGHDSAGRHHAAELVENLRAPHLRLLFRSERIEIHHVELPVGETGGEVAFLFQQGEIGSDWLRLAPFRPVEGVKEFGLFRRNQFRIAELPDDVFLQRIAFDGCIADMPSGLLGDKIRIIVER